MSLLKKQGFYNTLVLYAGTALGFFNLVILFQRVLTTEQIGFFSLLTNITLLYAQIAAVGINSVIIKYFPYYRSDDKKHGGFVTFVVAWCTAGFIAFTLLFVLCQHSIIAYYEGQKGATLLVKYFYYLVPLAFFTMVYTVIESLAITIFKNVLSSFLREVVLRLFTLISVLLIAWSLIDYHDFLTIYVVANIIMVVVLWFNIYKDHDFKLASISPTLALQKKQLVKYGLFTLLSSASIALIQYLDNIMLSFITGDLSIVGIYSTFFAIAMVISLPAKALSRTSMQIIAQAWSTNDLPKIGNIYFKTSVMQMLIGCLLFIGLIVNKDFIIVLLHKPDYANYFGVFIIVGLGFLTDITGGVNGYIINLSKHYKVTTILIVSAVIICVTANWLLIPRLGMIGAAIAYFLAMFILNFAYWLFIKVRFGLQPFGKTHFLILLISTVALLIGLYLPLNHNVYIDMVLRSAIVTVIYVSLAYFLKISVDINLLIDKVVKPRNSQI
ncbi:MAG: oligosaccharide flippase family protein [Bacteroidota bacterium]